jgi:hypothetical protein
MDDQIAPAFRSLVQWEADLPPRCKWNFENYTAHSIPGVALGSSFLFMHLVGRIGFVLLGLNVLNRASEHDLVQLMTPPNHPDITMGPPANLSQILHQASNTKLKLSQMKEN